MHAEIIAIGTELTTGAKLDTNSQWLSIELGAVGIPVHYHSTVADDLEAMQGVLRDAVNRADIVLITGGLGPTLDDLTRQAMAGLTNAELVLHEPSLEFIKSLFARFSREMPERNTIQAMFPEGSEPIPNLRGTAPGIWMEVPRKTSEQDCLLIAMPGVPSEMHRMFHTEVLPRLPGSGRVIRRARVNCFGLGESQAEEMLGDLTARGGDPDVGITVHEATITLRITAQGDTAEECQAKIDSAKAVVNERMGDRVFGEEDEELEHIVLRLLEDHRMTLSTAESGTGGVLAERLTALGEFARSYTGGVVVPNDRAMSLMLNVPPDLISSAGALSEQVAAAMAQGCRERFGTDFALAVTECPVFHPERHTEKAPTTFMALAGDGLLETYEQTLLGDITLIRSRAAKAMLDLLRRHLLARPRRS